MIGALGRVEVLPLHISLRLEVGVGRPRLFSEFVVSLVGRLNRCGADKNRSESEILK